MKGTKEGQGSRPGLNLGVLTLRVLVLEQGHSPTNHCVGVLSHCYLTL